MELGVALGIKYIILLVFNTDSPISTDYIRAGSFIMDSDKSLMRPRHDHIRSPVFLALRQYISSRLSNCTVNNQTNASRYEMATLVEKAFIE